MFRVRAKQITAERLKLKKWCQKHQKHQMLILLFKNYLKISNFEKAKKQQLFYFQQTFENKKFVDITQQCFALLPQGNFPTNNLNFH